MDSQTLVIIAGAVAAGFVQGLSGFGFGLVAMSFWAWTIDPRLAAAMAVFGALTGQIIAAVTVRRGFDLKTLAPFVLGGLLGLPMGMWLLPQLDVQVFKAFLGALLAVWCPAMLFSAQLPRITRGGQIADAVIGAGGGVMGALGGFTGVLPTLWCTLRGMQKDSQRAIVQNFNLSMLLVTFGTYVATGVISSATLPFLAIVAPAMLIPSLLGARLYIGISEATFRKVVLSLLTCTGIALLVSSVPGLLRRLA
ncbi:MAG: sulfite exporter TauE/SafE family protein [Polaromonas sp.]|uniref:sulfite exporter TauE/SafE family protein n=1 Tax=Polaromonas sp. TaxID=1869339 RepID=UPI002730DBFA|nr:sulfite exporter TauE/SafE family protein [Polaromonas sp.]MDP1742308.1 sulfite exporter TauE/SafE family protein [Polaromonas sp.]MDP3357095.1 sulfite exporter TauE/SafE family protein [Polaromonas sp.]